MKGRSFVRAVSLADAGLVVGAKAPQAAPPSSGPYVLRAQRNYGLIDMHDGDEYVITPGAAQPVTKNGQPVQSDHLITLMGFVADRQAEIIPAAAKWDAVRVIDDAYDGYLSSPEYQALLDRVRAYHAADEAERGGGR